VSFPLARSRRCPRFPTHPQRTSSLSPRNLAVGTPCPFQRLDNNDTVSLTRCASLSARKAFTAPRLVSVGSPCSAGLPGQSTRIALIASGDIFLTSVRDGAIIRRTPDGTQEIFARIDGGVSGIVTTPDDGLFVCCRQPHRPESICFIDARGRSRGADASNGRRVVSSTPGTTCRQIYSWQRRSDWSRG
jgi:hypothetical protein